MRWRWWTASKECLYSYSLLKLQEKIDAIEDTISPCARVAVTQRKSA